MTDRVLREELIAMVEAQAAEVEDGSFLLHKEMTANRTKLGAFTAQVTNLIASHRLQAARIQELEKEIKWVESGSRFTEERK